MQAATRLPKRSPKRPKAPLVVMAKTLLHIESMAVY